MMTPYRLKDRVTLAIGVILKQINKTLERDNLSTTELRELSTAIAILHDKLNKKETIWEKIMK